MSKETENEIALEYLPSPVLGLGRGDKSPLERGQIMSVQRLIRGVYGRPSKPEIETHPSIVLTGCAFNTHFPLSRGDL